MHSCAVEDKSRPTEFNGIYSQINVQVGEHTCLRFSFAANHILLSHLSSFSLTKSYLSPWIYCCSFKKKKQRERTRIKKKLSSQLLGPDGHWAGCERQADWLLMQICKQMFRCFSSLHVDFHHYGIKGEFLKTLAPLHLKNAILETEFSSCLVKLVRRKTC